MALKYASFYAAWYWLKLYWGWAEGYHDTVQYWVQQANAEAQGEAWQGCINKLGTAIIGLENAIESMFGFYETQWEDTPFMCAMYYAGQVPPTYTLTWQAIGEAWIKNDFEGRAPTIAIIDRMRQILWNEPYFIAWAARPEEQEF